MKRVLGWGIIMHQMHYPNILAFVEGSMEQLFLNNNFHYVEVIPVSNGVSWTMAALAQQIVTFFKARDSNADAFVVWVYREKRQESSQVISDYIRSSLINAGAEKDKIHILVCDIMTENIILADEQYIISKFNLDNYKYCHEGVGGKRYLKEMFLECGEHYRETRHGVSALKAIRLDRCAKASPAVSSFLATFGFSCWWIE